MGVGPAQRHELFANPIGIVPLMLLLVELLQVEQRVLIARIEPQHFVERFECAIDEAAALEIEPEAQKDVGVLGARQLGPLEQALMDLDSPCDLAALAVDVAEDQMDLDRIRVNPRRLAQLFDRDVDLVGDQEVEPEYVVMRIARAPPIDPLAVAQFVALPGLADGKARQQGQQRTDERQVVHASIVLASGSGSSVRPAALATDRGDGRPPRPGGPRRSRQSK